jgi:regulator of protease activity HflC (stomatin/prohibitin superfamily)
MGPIAMRKSFSRSAEVAAQAMNGLAMLTLLVLAGVAAFLLMVLGLSGEGNGMGALAVLLLAGVLIGLFGFYFNQPNEARALMRFGAYRGTDRSTGLRWIWPWYQRKKISLRVRNVTSDMLKVNDKNGNPIEIAANVVWRVEDSAQALFDVDNFETFNRIEIDTALRDIASHYSYDHAEEGQLSLRGHSEAVAELLTRTLQARLDIGGMTVDEARLSHLAYAPEIAGAMLRRQQADAVLDARTRIVTGAVSMVESALKQLNEKNVVTFSEERKAQLVANLLVVLCSDKDTQPVLNTGH